MAVPQQGAPSPAGAGVHLSRPAEPAAPDSDTTPPGLWNTAAAAASASAAAPGTAPGAYADGSDTEPRVAQGYGVPHPSGSGPAAGSPSVPGSVPGSDPAGDRARSLLIPVSDPEPRAPVTPAVAPVLPGVPVANRPQVRAPGPETGPENGPPCPWCATPNRPDRHFCNRCAMPMSGDGAYAPVRQSWWRRLLNWRNRETPWAGDRPRLRRGFGRVMNWVVGAVVLGLLVALITNIGDGVDATRDHFAKRAPVGPDTMKASRSYPGHSAKLAFDGLSNTWWGPGVSQSGKGEWIEASFANPTRLLDVVITAGVSAKQEHLQESALPHRIEVQITTADGKKSTKIINLDRIAGGQRRKFRVGEVSTVRFILDSAYAADSKKQTSIAEIEFFGRSNSSNT
ncbi:NADase-type glycan-binding domain-containing protein [Streptomyces sp. CWNU-52B]|uniref:NADase-type glycan-binding domain-containing protein n=1 Tax=unclassified Streptomyces TaxID=2593676 RepID=UPI0039C00C99